MVRGVMKMPDYKELYLTLMRETEKAIRTLTAAQQTCEELYLQQSEQEETVLPFPTCGPERQSYEAPKPNPATSYRCIKKN